MDGVKLNEVLSINELAAIRTLLGMPAATEQMIRIQLNNLKNKIKSPEEVGFSQVDHNSGIFLKVADPKLEEFRLNLLDWLSKNKPNLSK